MALFQMRILRLLLAGLMTASWLVGCAWVSQTATLKLEPRTIPSKIGQGRTVAVRVVDRRPARTIGYRGLDSKNAAITTDQNVADLFQQKLLESLARKGFTAIPHDGAPGRLVVVEVRQIKYTTDMEFWKGIVQTEAELVASMVKDGVKFEQAYLAERKETAIEAPSAKTNERLINGAVSDALQKLLEDERLLRFMAE
jgi:uncharacterized lipoprotein YajG